MKLKILGLSGSQREKSWSTALLSATRTLSPPGVEVHIFEEHKSWPLFNPDLECALPDSIQGLRDAVAAADAIIISSPEYAHGVSGTIKNTLDWLVGHPQFANKPVAVFNPAYQSYHADEALKETLRTMSAELIAAACVRIPVIGSGIEQNAIAQTPPFASMLSCALQSIVLHIEEKRRCP